MADGYTGLWPLVAAPQGDSSSVNGSATAGAHVSGEARLAFVGIGAITSTAQVAGIDAHGFVGYTGLWAVLGVVGAMESYAGAAASYTAVVGERKAANVQSGGISAGARVTGVDSSAGTGEPGFIGLLPLAAALQGSTLVLPWGVAASYAHVAGQGVYSILGDYATPGRSVFDVPPPADFKPPGVTLDYGLPTSLRVADAKSAEILAGSSATGQLRAVIVKAGEIVATGTGYGQLRAAIVATGETSGGAHVSGAAVGVTTIIATGSIAAGADVTGIDRSLTAGAALGITAAYSASAGIGVADNVQSGAAICGADVSGVDASGYPAAGAVGSCAAYSSVSGEAVASVVRTAQAHASAALAAVQATLAIADASASSFASVSGYSTEYTPIGPGRRRIGSSTAQGSQRIGSGSALNRRKKIGSLVE